MRSSGSRDAVQLTSSRTSQLPLLDMRPAPNSRRAKAHSSSRTRHRLKLGGGTCEIVALIVILVAIVIVVLDILVVVLLFPLSIVVLAIVEQLSASHGCVALELSQPKNVNAALFALVAGAK